MIITYKNTYDYDVVNYNKKVDRNMLTWIFFRFSIYLEIKSLRKLLICLIIDNAPQVGIDDQ